jgi:hypothetical protein
MIRYLFTAFVVFIPFFSYGYTEDLNTSGTTWEGQGSGTYANGESLIYISTPRLQNEVLNSVTLAVGSYYGGNNSFVQVYENPTYNNGSNVITSLGTLVATSDIVPNIANSNSFSGKTFEQLSTVFPFSSSVILNSGSTYLFVVNQSGNYNSFVYNGHSGTALKAPSSLLNSQLILTSHYRLDLSIPTYLGCTDSDALNYENTANTDDGSCLYPPPVSSYSSMDNHILATTTCQKVGSSTLCQYQYLSSNDVYKNAIVIFFGFVTFMAGLLVIKWL